MTKNPNTKINQNRQQSRQIVVLAHNIRSTHNIGAIFRSSVGFGLSWLSPVGPLRIAFANPIRKFAGDKIQKIQFQIGTSF